MRKDRVVTFRPDGDLLAAMALLRDRDGVPFSEQIRRALRGWLESKDVLRIERRPSSRQRSKGLPTWVRQSR